jgi:hypothetical protein
MDWRRNISFAKIALLSLFLKTMKWNHIRTRSRHAEELIIRNETDAVMETEQRAYL